MGRPAFKNLIENKLEPKDKLIITKLDRLGRNMIDVLATIELLKQREVELVCLQVGNIDLNSANGRLFLNVFAMVAQFEKDLLIERTKAGLERAKAQGKKLGRPSALTDEQKQEIMDKLKAGQSARSLSILYSVSRPVIVGLKKSLQQD
jgi:putative DNA-invertase from lambdoid prophage Rac